MSYGHMAYKKLLPPIIIIFYPFKGTDYARQSNSCVTFVVADVINRPIDYFLRYVCSLCRYRKNVIYPQLKDGVFASDVCRAGIRRGTGFYIVAIINRAIHVATS